MRSPSIAVRNLFRATRANPELAYWLSQEGLAKMAAEGKFSGAASEVRKGIDIFEAMVNSSKEVTVGPIKGAAKGATRILVPISKQAFQAAFRGEASGMSAMRDQVEAQALAAPATPDPDLGAPDGGPYYTPEEGDPGRSPQGSFDQPPAEQDNFRTVQNMGQYDQPTPDGGQPDGRPTELPNETLIQKQERERKEKSSKDSAGRKPSSTKKRKK